MENIIKLKSDKEIYAPNVFKNNGFERISKDDVDPEVINLFKQHGLNTCSDLYVKDGKTYLFDGWEHDQNRLILTHAKYIEAVEVTNLIQEVASCGLVN